jgi:hypothetical protein
MENNADIVLLLFQLFCKNNSYNNKLIVNRFADGSAAHHDDVHVMTRIMLPPWRATVELRGWRFRRAEQSLTRSCRIILQVPTWQLSPWPAGHCKWHLESYTSGQDQATSYILAS